MVWLNSLIVKNVPFSRVKTGESALRGSKFLRFLIASRGQQLWPGKLKSSMCSPFGFLLLGIFIQIFTWSSLISTSFQSKVSLGLNTLSLLEKSSPHLKEPKKAIQLAVQKTFLSLGDNFDFAISCPNNFKSGRVMAFRVFAEIFL